MKSELRCTPCDIQLGGAINKLRRPWGFISILLKEFVDNHGLLEVGSSEVGAEIEVNPSVGRKLRGRHKKINTPQRRQLIDVAIQDSVSRRLTFTEVAELADIQACEKVLREAFEAEGYFRRVARKKPFLDAAKKAKRLAWALAHEHWTIEDWRRVIWTNESYIRLNGKGGRVWVTRHAQEEFHEDCLVPKFQNKNSVMIWGAICGASGGTTSPVVVWQKQDWGNINAQTYCEHVISPVLYPYWYDVSQEEGFWCYVLEDGASAHRAKATQAVRDEYGMESLIWVASSPDLNPIEAIWRKIKVRLNKRADRATTAEGVCRQIQEEWAKLTRSEILELVDSMPDHIQAVIAANGGHTKY